MYAVQERGPYAPGLGQARHASNPEKGGPIHEISRPLPRAAGHCAAHRLISLPCAQRLNLRKIRMTEERVIRKYANRRLYDTTASRHVTLDDIRKMVGSGERVKVIDDKSGEDVTRSMLLQIISAQEQFGTPVLSTELLEAIIRFYGNPVQEMLTTYLEQSIGSLLRQQQVMRAEMAKAMESPMAPLADMARQNMELWAKMQASMLSSFTPPTPAPSTGPEKPKPRTGKRR
jgi:polyhydroxyalkanoate synthesis repressor PhaR